MEVLDNMFGMLDYGQIEQSIELIRLSILMPKVIFLLKILLIMEKYMQIRWINVQHILGILKLVKNQDPKIFTESDCKLTIDQANSTYQKGCVTIKYGSFQFPYGLWSRLYDNGIAWEIKQDKLVNAKSVINGKNCLPTLCTDAVETIQTIKDCNVFKKECISTGKGCSIILISQNNQFRLLNKKSDPLYFSALLQSLIILQLKKDVFRFSTKTKKIEEHLNVWNIIYKEIFKLQQK